MGAYSLADAIFRGYRTNPVAVGAKAVRNMRVAVAAYHLVTLPRGWACSWKSSGVGAAW